jgi:hypothetical protein
MPLSESGTFISGYSWNRRTGFNSMTNRNSTGLFTTVHDRSHVLYFTCSREILYCLGESSRLRVSHELIGLRGIGQISADHVFEFNLHFICGFVRVNFTSDDPGLTSMRKTIACRLKAFLHMRIGRWGRSPPRKPSPISVHRLYFYRV